MVKMCDHLTKIKGHPIPEDWVVCHFLIKQDSDGRSIIYSRLKVWITGYTVLSDVQAFFLFLLSYSQP